MRVGVACAVAVVLSCSSSSTTTTGGGGGTIPCAGDAGCPDGYLCTSAVCTQTSTDGQPPAVVSFTPANNDQNVWVGDVIRATFSEPMRLGDGDASVGLTLLGGGEVPKTLELSADGRTLTIHAPALAGPADVTVFFAPGLTDLSGLNVSMYPPFHWGFVCPLWQTPGGSFPQPSGPYGVDSGAVAVDSLGRGVAAVGWQPNGTDHAIRVHRWEGDAWAQKLDVALGADYVSDVRLAARGDAVVLAYSHAPWGAASSNVEVTTLRSDAWTSLPTLSVPVGGAIGIRLAVGPDLTPIVAWNDGSVVHGSRWSPVQDAWVPLVDIAAPSGGSSLYLGDLRVDAAGVVHAAFFDWTGYDGNVWVVQWTEGSADPLGGPATSLGAVLVGPSLAFDLSGHPVVSYEKTGGGFGVSRFDGSAWTETLDVPASGSDWRTRTSLAVDPVQGVFAGVQTGADRVSVWHDDGSGWVQEDSIVIMPFPLDVTFLQLADGAGTGPWAAYQPEAGFAAKRYNHQ